MKIYYTSTLILFYTILCSISINSSSQDSKTLPLEEAGVFLFDISYKKAKVGRLDSLAEDNKTLKKMSKKNSLFVSTSRYVPNLTEDNRTIISSNIAHKLFQIHKIKPDSKNLLINKVEQIGTNLNKTIKFKVKDIECTTIYRLSNEDAEPTFDNILKSNCVLDNTENPSKYELITVLDIATANLIGKSFEISVAGDFIYYGTGTF